MTERKDSKSTSPLSRREFVRSSLRVALLAAFGSFGGLVALRSRCVASDGKACGTCLESQSCTLPASKAARRIAERRTVWQLDPDKCIQCGQCATNCVLEQSAVKCVNDFERCGYCRLCFGYFQPGTKVLTSGAENQLCPTGAIKRKFIEDPYFEYTIDEALCIGCGKCVKACEAFGNASFMLQVRHDICVNCNDCSIGRHCPTEAYSRVSASHPYLIKKTAGKA